MRYNIINNNVFTIAKNDTNNRPLTLKSMPLEYLPWSNLTLLFEQVFEHSNLLWTDEWANNVKQARLLPFFSALFLLSCNSVCSEALLGSWKRIQPDLVSVVVTCPQSRFIIKFRKFRNASRT